jgi:hypothetical protein
VAAGQLPRESGVSMLVNFFNLPRISAEQVMGNVGRGFVPDAGQPSNTREGRPQ